LGTVLGAVLGTVLGTVLGVILRTVLLGAVLRMFQGDWRPLASGGGIGRGGLAVRRMSGLSGLSLDLGIGAALTHKRSLTFLSVEREMR
jgi:hypothetical protein